MKYKIILLASILQLISSMELLIASEFVKPKIIPSEITSWTKIKTKKCDYTLFADFSEVDIFGVFASETTSNSKTFLNLPPHWSLSIRFDLILYKSVDKSQNEYVSVYLDNTFDDKYTKSGPNDGHNICSDSEFGDILILYSKNITNHKTSSFSLKFLTTFNENDTSEGYGIRNLFLYVDTCHQSCLTCSGPTKEQCLTCPSSSVLNAGKCTCNSPKIFHNNSCVDSCPVGYIVEPQQNQCIIDYGLSTNNCNQRNAKPGQCAKCNSGYYLLNGQCVNQCPLYAPQNDTTKICEDYSSNLFRGSYLLNGLNSNTFGESEISGMKLSVAGFEGNGYGDSTSSGAFTSICGGVQLLGGPFLFSSSSYISRTFSDLQNQTNSKYQKYFIPKYLIRPPHSSIRVHFKYYILDRWDDFFDYVDVKLSSNVYTIVRPSTTATNICGVSSKDYIRIFDKTIAHSSSIFSFKIQSFLSYDSYETSFGIRDFFILIEYCTDNCDLCDQLGCLSCKTGFTLKNNQCTIVCSKGQFKDSNNICQPCHSSCIECDGSDENNCTSCDTNKILTNQNKCISNCNDYYYYDINLQKCKICSPECRSCFGPSSNECYDCLAGNYFYNYSCLSSCPFGYTKNFTSRMCEPCHQNCYGCIGTKETDCIKCIGTLVKQNSKCVEDCDDGYYKDIEKQLCQLCHSTCASCYGSLKTNCIKCKSNYFYDPYQQLCVTRYNCSDSLYPDEQTQQCLKCHETCYTCSGKSKDTCLSCKQNQYLHNKECIIQCPDGTYVQNSECKICNSKCKTCKGGSINECSSCSLSKYLYNGTCIDSCPIGTSLFQNECFQCDNSCKHCSKALSSSDCTECYPNVLKNNKKQEFKIEDKYVFIFINKAKFLMNNACIDKCPSDTFLDGQNCKQCHSTCLTCNDSSENSCLTCSSQQILLNGKCIPCPPGESSVNNICTSCHSKCQTCYGKGENQCLSCFQGTYLQMTECVSTCDSDYITQTQTNECIKKCDTKCITCEKQNYLKCTSCTSDKILYNQECLDSCPFTFFYNKITKQCEKCSDNCNLCISKDQCTSCKNPYFISQFICIKECPAEKYCYNAQLSECEKCPEKPKPQPQPQPDISTEQQESVKVEKAKLVQEFDYRISKIFNLYIAILIIIFLYCFCGMIQDKKEEQLLQIQSSPISSDEESRLNQTQNLQTPQTQFNIQLNKTQMNGNIQSFNKQKYQIIIYLIIKEQLKNQKLIHRSVSTILFHKLQLVLYLVILFQISFCSEVLSLTEYQGQYFSLPNYFFTSQ